MDPLWFPLGWRLKCQPRIGIRQNLALLPIQTWRLALTHSAMPESSHSMGKHAAFHSAYVTDNTVVNLLAHCEASSLRPGWAGGKGSNQRRGLCHPVHHSASSGLQNPQSTGKQSRILRSEGARSGESWRPHVSKNSRPKTAALELAVGSKWPESWGWKTESLAGTSYGLLGTPQYLQPTGGVIRLWSSYPGYTILPLEAGLGTVTLICIVTVAKSQCLRDLPLLVSGSPTKEILSYAQHKRVYGNPQRAGAWRLCILKGVLMPNSHWFYQEQGT